MNDSTDAEPRRRRLNPVRAILDLHPPWAHGVFWLIWAITATIGPISLVVGLVNGSAAWWIGLLVYAVALITLALDWLAVSWLRSHRQGWVPWQAPGLLS